jgi:hypothetical protein
MKSLKLLSKSILLVLLLSQSTAQAGWWDNLKNWWNCHQFTLCVGAVAILITMGIIGEGKKAQEREKKFKEIIDEISPLFTVDGSHKIYTQHYQMFRFNNCTTFVLQSGKEIAKSTLNGYSIYCLHTHQPFDDYQKLQEFTRDVMQQSADQQATAHKDLRIPAFKLDQVANMFNAHDQQQDQPQNKEIHKTDNRRIYLRNRFLIWVTRESEKDFIYVAIVEPDDWLEPDDLDK